MSNILDICEKALNGPIMKEEDFDFKLMMAVMEFVKETGVQYDPDNPVPSDDAAADRVFEAAKKLVQKVGVYSLDTARVMEFAQPEIEAAVRNAPGRVKVGQGIDRKYFGMRMPDEHKWPWFQVGSGIVSSKPAYASNIVEGYASIPEVNSIQIPGCQKFAEYPFQPAHPPSSMPAFWG